METQPIGGEGGRGLDLAVTFSHSCWTYSCVAKLVSSPLPVYLLANHRCLMTAEELVLLSVCSLSSFISGSSPSWVLIQTYMCYI